MKTKTGVPGHFKTIRSKCLKAELERLQFEGHRRTSNTILIYLTVGKGFRTLRWVGIKIYMHAYIHGYVNVTQHLFI